MPARQMSSINRPGHTDVRWFHSETVTDANSDPVIVPSIGRDAAIAVTPGTNAKVQYTLSDYDAIEADTAVWYDWDAGVITDPTADAVAGSVSALRLVSTGASSWQVSV